MGKRNGTIGGEVDYLFGKMNGVWIIYNEINKKVEKSIKI